MEDEYTKPETKQPIEPMVAKTDNITIEKGMLWKVSTFVFASLFILSVFSGGFGFFNNASVGTGAVIGDLPPTGPSQDVLKLLMEDDAVKGDKDAPVTIVEFSDYECPYCGRFFSETYSQIKSEYIDTGKVKMIFRDFPLGFHKDAQKAAEAAECAGELGGDESYWEMHDKIFQNQGAIGIDNLKSYAQQIGLDRGKFSTCLDSGQMENEVKKDFKDGQAAGVEGTPAFFINGKLLSGAQPFSAFQQAIEAEL